MQEITYALLQPAWWQNPWIVAGLVAAFCGIVLISLGLRLLYQKYRVVSPVRQVLKAIKNLSAQGLKTQEEQKEFYSSLTHLLKRYVSLQSFGMRLTITDEEFLNELTELPLPSELAESIRLIFEQGKLVKFAQRFLSPDFVVDQQNALLPLLESYQRIAELKNTKT